MRGGATRWYSNRGTMCGYPLEASRCLGTKSGKQKKYTARYYGPFRIVRQTSPVTYELELPAASNIHPIMHVSLLKPWVQGSVMDAPPLPDAKRGAEEYEEEYGERGGGLPTVYRGLACGQPREMPSGCEWMAGKKI